MAVPDESLFGQVALRLARSPEDAATEALIYLLTRSIGAQRVVKKLADEWAGRPLRPIARFRSQVTGADGSRPDIEAQDADGVPVFILENKFWAPLTREQPAAYLRRLAGLGGVLCFAVPAHRVGLLWPDLVRRTEETEGAVLPMWLDESQLKVARIADGRALALVSWGYLLDQLDDALDAEGENALAGDARQLRGLVVRMERSSPVSASLTPRETEFLLGLAESGRTVFTSQDAVPFWGRGQYARNVLSGLESKGRIERIERGLYLIIPSDAGPERLWSEDPLVVGSALAPESAAAYWTAARYWRWTTQLPRTTFFVSPKRRYHPRLTIMGVDYRFTTVKPERLFGIHLDEQGGRRIRVTDPERTVLDFMDRPDLCGGIAEVADMLCRAWSDIDPRVLTGYLERLGGGTPPKRLGFLAERLQLPGAEHWLPKWRDLIGSGFTALERGGAPGGKLLRAWNLRVNVSGFADEDAR